MVDQTDQKQILTDMLVIPQQIELVNYTVPAQQSLRLIAHFSGAADGVLVQLQVEHDPAIYTILLSPSTPQATFYYMPIFAHSQGYRYRYEVVSGGFGGWSAYCSPEQPLVIGVRG